MAFAYNFLNHPFTPLISPLLGVPYWTFSYSIFFYNCKIYLCDKNWENKKSIKSKENQGKCMSKENDNNKYLKNKILST